MASLWLVATVLAAPPTGGLVQKFQQGEVFRETIDVRVTSLSSATGRPPTTLHYLIELDTVTDRIISETDALLDSNVFRLAVETSVGDQLSARYDSSDRQLIGSVDRSTFASDKLAELWSPYRGTSVIRRAGADGSLKVEDILGLPLDAREQPTTVAFQHSISQLISVKLPPGPIESWTDQLDWPVNGETLKVLRVYTALGRTADGLDKIEIAAAAVGEDGVTRLEDPPLVARGSLLFDPSRGRVTRIELVTEMKQPQLTRTNIAWRIEPAARVRDPLSTDPRAKEAFP